MIKKFKYKPSLELLLSGISGVFCGVLFVVTEEFELYDLIFMIKATLSVFGFFAGVKFIQTFFEQRTHGHIAVSDTFVQLPQYLLKPKQIDFKDIIFVSEREAADGIIKISSKSGFDEIKRKFMIPAEFDELLRILKANSKE